MRFVNRFYDWWLGQRVNSVIERYQQEVRLELSEDFKRQLRSSRAFRGTAIEATELVAEAAAYSAVPHSSEEQDAFRNAWRARAEKLAQRVAEGDPLAAQVILKAIEKESKMR